MKVDERPDTQGRLTLTAQTILNQRQRGGFTWQTTEKEIKVCSKVVKTSVVVVAAANRPQDAIRTMTVRPTAVASRVAINRAAASSKVVSKVETNLAADKKKADRTKKPDANAGAVHTKGSRVIFLDKEFHS